MRKHAGLVPTLPLDLVEEIGGEVLVAEEQPVAPAASQGLALFHEGPEWRDARAGTDHDDARVGIFRKSETGIGRGIDFERFVLAKALAHEGRAHALARAAVTLVAGESDKQMNFLLVGQQAGRDGVEARLQAAKHAHENLCLEASRRVGRKHVDDFPTMGELLEARFLSLLKQRGELCATGLAGVGLHERTRDGGDLECLAKGFDQRSILAIHADTGIRRKTGYGDEFAHVGGGVAWQNPQCVARVIGNARDRER